MTEFKRIAPAQAQALRAQGGGAAGEGHGRPVEHGVGHLGRDGALVDQGVLLTVGVQIDHAGFTRLATLRQGLTDDLGDIQIGAVAVLLNGRLIGKRHLATQHYKRSSNQHFKQFHFFSVSPNLLFALRHAEGASDAAARCHTSRPAAVDC